MNLSVSYFADIISNIDDDDDDCGFGHDPDCDRYTLTFIVMIASEFAVVMIIANVQDDVIDI